jgi:hypothetical protein
MKTSLTNKGKVCITNARLKFNTLVPLVPIAWTLRRHLQRRRKRPEGFT